MAYLEPGKPSAQIDEMGYDLCIKIPAPRNVFMMLFLPFWLCGWGIGEFQVSNQFLRGHGNSFLMLWIVGWTIGGCFALYTLLVMLFGREIVWVAPTGLRIKRDILGFGSVQEYRSTDIKDLRTVSVDPTPAWTRRNESAWATSSGTLAFDYGSKTYRFGAGIAEAEAKDLLERMRRQLKVNG